MSLEQTISEAIKTAMREKDRVALDSLRAVKAQIILMQTEARGAEVSPEQEIAILQRMIKQRKDSYEQFTAQGRTDLAEVEEAQSKIIEKFLPKQLSAEELESEIKKIEDQMCLPDFYDDIENAAGITRFYEENKLKLAELTDEWENALMELEEL